MAETARASATSFPIPMVSYSLSSLSCAWLLHPKNRSKGKGMLEVPWLAVELREWIASTRSTFHRVNYYSSLLSKNISNKIPRPTNKGFNKQNCTTWSRRSNIIRFPPPDNNLHQCRRQKDFLINYFYPAYEKIPDINHGIHKKEIHQR